MAGTVSSRCVPNSPPNEWPKPIPTTSNGDRARRSHAAHEVDGAAEQAVRIRQLQNGRAPATAGSAMTHEDLEFVLDCTCPWLSTEESFVEAWYVRGGAGASWTAATSAGDSSPHEVVKLTRLDAGHESLPFLRCIADLPEARLHRIPYNNRAVAPRDLDAFSRCTKARLAPRGLLRPRGSMRWHLPSTFVKWSWPTSYR